MEQTSAGMAMNRSNMLEMIAFSGT